MYYKWYQLVNMGISNVKFLNQSTFLLQAAKAINSNSMVEGIEQVCFLDLCEMVAPPRVLIHQLVDLDLNSEFQLASLNLLIH